MTDCLQVAKTYEHTDNYRRKKKSIFAAKLQVDATEAPAVLSKVKVQGSN